MSLRSAVVVGVIGLCLSGITQAISASDKEEERPAKLVQLSGILERYEPGQHAKAMPSAYLILDGHGSQPSRYFVKGRALEGVETGRRILVQGSFSSYFFHSQGAALSGWRVCMEVQKVEILEKPFDEKTGIPELR